MATKTANNNLRDMLTEAAKTGVVPDREAIEAIITERHSLAGVAGTYNDIRRAAQRAVDAAGHKRLLAGVIDASVAELGEATGAAVDDDQSALASSTGGYTVVNGRRIGARDLSHAEPLKALMQTAASGQQIQAKDVDALNLDPSLTEKQRAELRAELLDAADEITSVFRGGAQIEARRLAAAMVGDFGDKLAHTEPVDDTDGMDPEQLAALVTRRGH